MRLSGKITIIALLALGCAGRLAAAASLKVHVRAPDGGGLAGFTVTAVEYGLYGPSTHSRTGVTDTAGDAILSLDGGRDYTVYFSSHGFSPALAEQFHGRRRDAHNSVRAASGVHYSTFTAFPAAAPAARLRLEFSGAAPGALLTGEVRDLRAGRSLGPLLARADAAGRGSLLADNIPYAGPGAYNVSLYDPRLNRGAGRVLEKSLDESLPLYGGARTLVCAGPEGLTLGGAGRAARPSAAGADPERETPPGPPDESGPALTAPAAGALRICVTARSGVALPGAYLRLDPGARSARAGEDGCAELAGLPAGEYLVQAQTQLSGRPGAGARRVSVTGDVKSSFIYVLPTGLNRSGLVRGTARFPAAADLRAAPLRLMLYPQCAAGLPCPDGDAVELAGAGASAYDFELNVASGSSYYLYAAADGWGRVRRGGYGDMVNLASTGTAVIDLFFEPAGTVSGRVYGPDGTPLNPAAGLSVWVDANNGRDWAGVQLGQDGSYSITGALAGPNRLSLLASGGAEPFRYVLQPQASPVLVKPGSPVKADLRLARAELVGIALDRAWDASASLAADQDLLLGLKAAALPAGSALDEEAARDILAGGGAPFYFNHAPAAAGPEDGPCGPGWPGGFCAAPLPAPGIYDLYLLGASDFGDMAAPRERGAPYPHFSVLATAAGVKVSEELAVSTVNPAYPAGPADGVRVNMSPGLPRGGGAALAGRVKLAGFPDRRAYERLRGDLLALKRAFPAVLLYGEDGGLKAAGLVLPAMDFLAAKERDGAFTAAFRRGYREFRALLDEAPYFAYEIRGLAPGVCYRAALAAPGRPSIQARACAGPAGSVTALDFDPAAPAGR